MEIMLNIHTWQWLGTPGRHLNQQCTELRACQWCKCGAVRIARWRHPQCAWIAYEYLTLKDSALWEWLPLDVSQRLWKCDVLGRHEWPDNDAVTTITCEQCGTERINDDVAGDALHELADSIGMLYPDGRYIYYEGDTPIEFAQVVSMEFGFDPSDDPQWGHGQYRFHCPARHLDAIYSSGRWPMGT